MKKNGGNRLLCLDCEPGFIAVLRGLGFSVAREDLGYRTGTRNIVTPPHETNATIINLETPACFDRLQWGPGQNDNLQCTIEAHPSDEHYRRQGESERYPRFQMVGSQIRAVPHSFDMDDIFAAVERAGRPLIIFLNKSVLRHLAPHDSLFGLDVRFEGTTANEVEIIPWLQELLPEFGKGALGFQLPLRYRIRSMSSPRPGGPGSAIRVVTNAVGDVFSIMMPLGRGFVWMIPEVANPSRIVQTVLGCANDIAQLLTASPDHRITPSATRAVTAGQEYDVFICFASEDRQGVAGPLAKALIGAGLRVWYDEFQLKLGDSLNQAISRGLLKSKYGVVILSPAFFGIGWRQQELNGLMAREVNGKKVILPIWHQVTRDEVAKYAPILADKVAVNTSEGIAQLTKAIVDVVRSSGMSVADTPTELHGPSPDAVTELPPAVWPDPSDIRLHSRRVEFLASPLTPGARTGLVAINQASADAFQNAANKEFHDAPKPEVAPGTLRLVFRDWAGKTLFEMTLFEDGRLHVVFWTGYLSTPRVQQSGGSWGPEDLLVGENLKVHFNRFARATNLFYRSQRICEAFVCHGRIRGLQEMAMVRRSPYRVQNAAALPRVSEYNVVEFPPIIISVPPASEDQTDFQAFVGWLDQLAHYFGKIDYQNLTA